ncbi:M57 family metalloprotease [Paucilactobacillus kaifaensis]|uniref:M57 family metalloprotease n=1 Tax=Paucilactobacillus kaifaensis TaxID=2559921 RepID=UPI001CC3C476|nr:M57 family metalloprotease [Paucilactobacillus kaifaensis]
MKRKTWLVWLAIVVGFVVLPATNVSQGIPGQINTTIRKYVDRFLPDFKSVTETYAPTKNTESTTGQSASEQTESSQNSTTEQTPMESNVQGQSLSRTYYYHFDDNVPASARKVFKEAIQIYNQTGIVKLVAGAGTQKQNQITFSVYRKVMAAPQQGTIELGRGGPDIITQVGWDPYVANHAKASLNINYPGLIKESVAIHELGHALGLAHSSSQSSVMYPIDRGSTVLTDADISGLKQIYDQ